ncbi:MAG: STAS domain-containing protein [Fibrobacterota bacterium]
MSSGKENDAGREAMEALQKYRKKMSEKKLTAETPDKYTGRIAVSGILNSEKSESFASAVGKVFSSGPSNLIVNLTETENIYTVGLAELVKAYKKCAEADRKMVLVVSSPNIYSLFEAAKLDRIMDIVRTPEKAAEIITGHEKEVAGGELAKRKEREEEVKKKIKQTPCWEYWNGKNPSNLNSCVDCYYRVSGTERPCWIIQGEIEGVSFEYVSEECLECGFYKLNNE